MSAYDPSHDMNLVDFMVQGMRKFGTSTALIDPKSRKSYTFEEVIDRIQRLAAGLHHQGLRQGDVLCVMTFNSIDFPVTVFATNYLGATLQTCSPDYTEDLLETRFKECNTKFLITLQNQIGRIKRIKQKLQKPKDPRQAGILNKIITMESTEDYISYDSLFNFGKITQAEHVNDRLSPAYFLSSSGTTGLSKPVILTHCNVIANLPQQQEFQCHVAGDCAILCLPMFHHYGILTVMTVGMYYGVKHVVMGRFNFEEFISLIKEYKAKTLQIVPSIAVRLIKQPDKSGYDMSSVKYVLIGAAPVGKELEVELLKLFNIPLISQGYGSTETGFVTGNKVGASKLGSVGLPPKGVQIKIVDPETEAVLGPNKVGEVLVKGPQVTIGYVNKEEKNKEAFDQEGDLAFYDEECFYFLVDRLKELIKYKSLQVAPAYLEDLLVKHPDVADAAVIGVPDPNVGELPKAFVVKQPTSSVTAQELCQYVEDRVAAHMRLRGGVEFVSQIPKSGSGKILRRVLKLRNQNAKL